MENVIIRTYDEIHEKIMNIAHAAEANGFKPDIVAGISRNGLIPGVILSHYFNTKLISITASFRDHKDYEINEDLLFQIARKEKVLIVDDILDTGDTLFRISRDYVEGFEENVRIGVVYYRESSKMEALVDYIGGRLYNSNWIRFPWEFKND